MVFDPRRACRLSLPSLFALVSASLICAAAPGGNVAAAELPSFTVVSKDYTPIACSDINGKRGLINLYKRTEDQQLLAELPKNYRGKRYFFALTLSSGDTYAGLQSNDLVVTWRRYGNRLAMIAPNLETRATGDAESRASVKRLFTDQVVLDVPILAIGPKGGPVIDADALMIGNASRFFGPSVRVTNSRITSIKKAKVFPGNVEIAFEIVGRNNNLQTLHYSVSEVPSTTGYKPRKADARVGYFTTTYDDLSKYDDEQTRVRLINRWKLEKRDPKLKLSPPKEPIRFYLEHTTPVRYRRWVKAGVDYWNKAFEKVGLVDAIVIEYQDATTGVHMEKDPEDVRYNFIRWLNNNIGTAIGPSRVHPETGQILDADIILTDGWIRHFNFNYHDLMPKLAMEGMSPETLAWLSEHPNWDPRVRFAAPGQRDAVQRQIAREASSPLAGYKMAAADTSLLGDDEYDGLFGHMSQKNGLCMAAGSRRMDLALARMNWALAMTLDAAAEEDKKKDEEKKKDADEADAKDSDEDDSNDEEGDDDDDADEDKKDNDKDADAEDKDDDQDEEETKAERMVDTLDNMPDWFVGPLLADLVSHEVGHTLGLRHNFK
ncbi:MAG: DUF5117 domain-containing protein, partial [Planctomycetota bacterium]